MNNLSTDVLVKPVPFCFLKMTSWRQWVKQTNRYDRSNPCVCVNITKKLVNKERHIEQLYVEAL